MDTDSVIGYNINETDKRYAFDSTVGNVGRAFALHPMPPPCFREGVGGGLRKMEFLHFSHCMRNAEFNESKGNVYDAGGKKNLFDKRTFGGEFPL